MSQWSRDPNPDSQALNQMLRGQTALGLSPQDCDALVLASTQPCCCFVISCRARSSGSSGPGPPPRNESRRSSMKGKKPSSPLGEAPPESSPDGKLGPSGELMVPAASVGTGPILEWCEELLDSIVPQTVPYK